MNKLKKTIRNILLTAIFFIFCCISVVSAQGEFLQANNAPQNNISVPQDNSIKPVVEYEKSSIEKLFASDINISSAEPQSELKQIGYDFFSNAMVQGFGKYEGSYKLNIGEKVDVYFWGDSVDMLSISGSTMLSPLTKSQVDTKGNIFVPGVGIVKAEGRSISDVERDIQSQAGQKFTNVKVRITVADSTDFTVFVYGYVGKPGKVAVNNNSSIIEALAAAGGVKKNGSLRNITYNKNVQNVDLYKIILQGQSPNIKLKPNDTIFVNKISSVVAIKNGVKTPGIYEISPLESLSEIIDYAGGFLPSTDKSIINIKAYNSKEGQRISMDIPNSLFKKTKLANGDILEFRSLYGKAEDFVSLAGNVKHPGIFEYKKGMKLSDVLKNKNELLDETFIHQAVIKRSLGDDKRIISIPVSLDNFFNGGNNPTLKPKDIITVYKNTSSKFIEVYGCIDKPKQLPYNENLTLKDVMADVQFISSSTSESNFHNISNNAVSTNISNNNFIIPAYDIAVEITNENNLDTRTIYLYDVLVQSDNVADIKINSGDKILFRPLRENEVVKTVKVSGYVNKPGVYKFVEGKKLFDAINTAGGLSKTANLRGIVFKRVALAQKEKEVLTLSNERDEKQIAGQAASDTNASKEDIAAREQMLNDIREEKSNLIKKCTGRIALNIQSNDLNKLADVENIDIQDGDEIYIPKFSNHVMVIGEVYNETSFIYKEGANASYYINLVGGYTSNARRTKLYKIGVNGQAHRLRFLASDNIQPGDTIVVPRKIRGNDWITPVTSTLQSIASLLTSLFIVTKL